MSGTFHSSVKQLLLSYEMLRLIESHDCEKRSISGRDQNHSMLVNINKTIQYLSKIISHVNRCLIKNNS